MFDPAYLRGCPGGGQSACIRTLTTSVGCAEITANAPVVIPAKIRMTGGGLLEFECDDNAYNEMGEMRHFRHPF